MPLTWFYSRTARHAGRMHKHVCKILAAQRDLLSPQAIEAVEGSMANLHGAMRNGMGKKEIQKEMENLEKSANKWLKPYPFAGARENIEVFLVAIAVAMAVRTFFLQPFKIPTGSMQPTLYGITSDPDFSRDSAFHRDLAPESNFQMPNFFSRFVRFWLNGEQYKQKIAREDGRLTLADDAPKKFLLFNLRQTFYLGDEQNPRRDAYTVWFPPDNFLKRTGLANGYGQLNPKPFKKGEPIFKIKSNSGDHLFVDRLSYNFRRPKRGEIIVFETRGIEGLQQDQYYIKRMVAMGGETVQIGNDRHLVINQTNRLHESTPHFEHVYSFNPAEPPRESHFSGHVNQYVAHQNGLGELAPLFRTAEQQFKVQPNHYLVMGDNTVNSLDSRAWGDFPELNVIGKSFFVYWPFGSQNGRDSRFGWGHR